MRKQIVQTPINTLGYGVVGYNLWKQMSKMYDLYLCPISNITVPASSYLELDERLIESTYKPESYHLYSDSPILKIWHDNLLADRSSKGEYSIYTFFEKDRFSKSSVSQLKACDKIILPSNWAKQIVCDQVRSENVYVVNSGVDRNIFNESASKVEKHNKCIFLNCGKWEKRKGHDVIYKAFIEACKNNNNVELWMICDNPFLDENERKKWESVYSHPKIKIIPRVRFQEELAEIFSHAFCGVFPARSEGWNLELLEFMSMGKFVITTNYSAHTEFCSSDNSFLIDIDKLEPVYDGIFFKGNDNGNWACLDGSPYQQLVEYMDYVYSIWLNDKTKLNINGIQTAKNLSWENIGNKLKEVLDG